MDAALVMMLVSAKSRKVRMPTAQKAKIWRSDDRCMAGEELRRLREASGLSPNQIATRMSKAGWGWYRCKVRRLEDTDSFCLHPSEMQQLLDILKATTL